MIISHWAILLLPYSCTSYVQVLGASTSIYLYYMYTKNDLARDRFNRSYQPTKLIAIEETTFTKYCISIYLKNITLRSYSSKKLAEQHNRTTSTTARTLRPPPSRTTHRHHRCSCAARTWTSCYRTHRATDRRQTSSRPSWTLLPLHYCDGHRAASVSAPALHASVCATWPAGS